MKRRTFFGYLAAAASAPFVGLVLSPGTDQQTTSITGLDHLDGTAVSVVAEDGVAFGGSFVGLMDPAYAAMYREDVRTFMQKRGSFLTEAPRLARGGL